MMGMSMTIEEAKEHLSQYIGDNRVDYDDLDAIEVAIETMRKYQMFQAEYENRLKADMVAMLTEIQLEIEEKEQYYQDEFLKSKNAIRDAAMGGRMFGCGDCKEIIQQKIDKLKGGAE